MGTSVTPAEEVALLVAELKPLISKEAFKRRLIDNLWKARAATSPKALGQVVLSEVVLEAIRKEVRRQTSHNADAKDLARILREEVLRPDAQP
ncbi:MAG: hypothetical protein JWQ95_5366 [Sphaerisporangium sp.]|nr:hypothetical protein [Sphaerisporangium sp.]